MGLHITLSQKHMACTFSFHVWCEPPQQRRVESILAEMHRLTARLELLWSEYVPGNSVAAFNDGSDGTSCILDQSTADLMQLALKCEHRTGGAFSPFSKSTSAVKPVWDAASRRLTKTDLGQWLSFGAIGKGAALDLIRQALVLEGIDHFLLDGGGSSLVFQNVDLPFAWKISPTRALELRTAKQGTVCLGISGTEAQGAHIVGGRGELFSVLAVGPNCAEADAYSTAHMVQDQCMDGWGFALSDCNQEIKCNNGLTKWIQTNSPISQPMTP